MGRTYIVGIDNSRSILRHHQCPASMGGLGLCSEVVDLKVREGDEAENDLGRGYAAIGPAIE